VESVQGTRRNAGDESTCVVLNAKVLSRSVGGGVVGVARNETKSDAGVQEIGPGERSWRDLAVGKRDGVTADSSVDGVGGCMKRVVFA